MIVFDVATCEAERRANWRRKMTRKRRKFLGAVLGIAGVTLPPVERTVASARRTAQGRQHRFEVRAAEGVEFTYHAKVAGPVSGVTLPERGPGAEPGPDGNDSVERLSDGTFHIEGTTGFGENDVWEFTTLLGFWATTTNDDYALFMDGDPFEWYGLDTTLPTDFKFFEVRAEPGVETFRYEFTALTNATNLGSPSDAAAELFGNDFVTERDDVTYVRGATGRGESDTWILGWSPGDPDPPVTDFSTTASRDEYALVYGDSEISPDDVS